MKHLILCSLFFSHFISVSQNTPEQYWKHFIVKNDSLGTILINVTKKLINKKKPLLLFLEGSGNFPVFFSTKKGRYSTGITLNYQKYSSKYHIVIISKPGIPFIDSLRHSKTGRRYYPTNKIYNKYYSLHWRAKSASFAINYLIDNLSVDTSQIIVMGHSEGSQVAPAVAVVNPKVTHVISMMGNALNQLYDFIIEERIKAEKGIISPTEAQKNIDSLYIDYEKIYANPKSISQKWFGETYYKWSSFTLKSPIEYMLTLNIPILYISGGLDKNQNIINMDFAKLEFIKRGKKNLTYKVYPNYDHYFQEKVVLKDKTNWIDHINEVHDFAIKWIK